MRFAGSNLEPCHVQNQDHVILFIISAEEIEVYRLVSHNNWRTNDISHPPMGEKCPVPVCCKVPRLYDTTRNSFGSLEVRFMSSRNCSFVLISF